MALQEMVLLNMTFRSQYLDEILKTLEKSHDFYPQLASHFSKNGSVSSEEETYKRLKERFVHIGKEIDLYLDNELEPRQSLNIETVENNLTLLENKVQQIKDIQNQIVSEKEENEKVLIFLKNFKKLNMNLDLLHSIKYIQISFGRIEKVKLNALTSYTKKPFFFEILDQDNRYAWGLYIVTHKDKLIVDNIFQSLGFEEIKIPQFIHGTIEESIKELQKEITAMNEYLLCSQQKIATLREKYKVEILKTFQTICYLQKIEAFKVFVVDLKDYCAIYGFIPKQEIIAFKELFEIPIDYEELPVDILKNVQCPTIIKNAKIVEPFEFVSHITSSDLIDTTCAYAFLYYFVFMVLLGDLGMGMILILYGLTMQKKKMKDFILSLGIPAFLGGIVYGQLFYTVHLYSALIMPMPSLLRVILGIVSLAVGTVVINIFKKVRFKKVCFQ